MTKFFSNSHLLLTLFKVNFLIFSNISSTYADEYESTKNKGMNKYQRIGEIESYLEKMTKELPKEFEEKIKLLQAQISELSNKDSKNIDPLKSELINLQRQVAELEARLNKRISDEVLTLNKKIDDQKKDQEIVIDSLRSSLEAKILAIEKTISNFGKIPNP